ncbi:hypothetical protein OAF16_02340 [Flavobacteriales bacterium]|nr:hypothetical protein [Flavobacteriales bacterium]
MRLLLLMFLFVACSPKTMNSVVSINEESSFDDSIIVRVIYNESFDESCRWYLQTKGSNKLLPVFWDEKLKVKNNKINLQYSLSRAPQPLCFKGKMIVVDSYTILKN